MKYISTLKIEVLRVIDFRFPKENHYMKLSTSKLKKKTFSKIIPSELNSFFRENPFQTNTICESSLPHVVILY